MDVDTYRSISAKSVWLCSSGWGTGLAAFARRTFLPRYTGILWLSGGCEEAAVSSGPAPGKDNSLDVEYPGESFPLRHDHARTLDSTTADGRGDVRKTEPYSAIERG